MSIKINIKILGVLLMGCGLIAVNLQLVLQNADNPGHDKVWITVDDNESEYSKNTNRYMGSSAMTVASSNYHELQFRVRETLVGRDKDRPPFKLFIMQNSNGTVVNQENCKQILELMESDNQILLNYQMKSCSEEEQKAEIEECTSAIIKAYEEDPQRKGIYKMFELKPQMRDQLPAFRLYHK